MNKIVLLARGCAFAHHTAADIVDAEIYSMINDNASDTPHADLNFDMGRDVREERSFRAVNQVRDKPVMASGIAMDTDPALDTMIMLKDIANQILD